MSVGYHIGGLKALEEHLKLGNSGPVQFFSGSPKTLRQEFVPGTMDASSIQAVCHGPFVMSLATDMAEPLFRASLQYAVKVAEYLNSIGVKYFVVHIGGKKPYQTLKDAAWSIINFCWKWTYETEIKGLSTVLCLENDCGSSTGSKPGVIEMVYQVVKKVDHPRIRIAFDTLHAYSSGFDLSNKDRIEKILRYTEVVHLNSIPKEVGAGSHLDRHSETRIEDSKPDQLENVLYIAQRAEELGKIQILERDPNLVPLDMNYLARRSII